MFTSEARRQIGISLIEQIVFIVIVGVAVTGVLAVLNATSRASADSLTQKQALAIAEALLEEAQLQPFTYCDPDDTQAATALSATVGATGCNATVEAIGPEGESRYSSTTPFDNVNDYHGFDSGTASPSGIRDIGGSLITGLDGYVAGVNVAGQALGAIGAAESLLITVTVTGPYNTQVVLQGYRVRYAPNSLP